MTPGVTFSILCACLVFGVVAAIAVQVPAPTTSPINITYNIGKNAELRCKVANIGKNTVTWRRLSNPVPISVGTTKFTPSKKYRVTYDKATQEWLLIIRQLELADAGEYECRVTGVDGPAHTLSLNMPGKHNTHIEAAASFIEADPGESAVLPCIVNNLKKQKVAWVNEKGGLVAFRKKVLSGNDRFRVQHNTREEWSLKVKNIRDIDYGSYTCLVNTDPVLTRTVTLKNKGPPRKAPVLKRDTYKRSIHVKEGEPATLFCEFDSFPVATIAWLGRFKVGSKVVKKALTTKGSRLHIASARPEDAGNYTCSAHNGIPPLARAKVRLHVELKPTTEPPRTTPSVPTGPGAPIAYVDEDEVRQRKGHNAFLVCKSVAHPAPHLYWMRRGRRISDSFKYRVRTSSHGQHRRHSELRIVHVQNEDFGAYDCHAFNSWGQHHTSVHLIEQTN